MRERRTEMDQQSNVREPHCDCPSPDRLSQLRLSRIRSGCEGNPMNTPGPVTVDRFTCLKQELARPLAVRRWTYLGMAWFFFSWAILPMLVLLLVPESWRKFLTQEWAGTWSAAVVSILVIFGPSGALISFGDRLHRKQFNTILDELITINDPRVVGLLLTLPETTAADPGSECSGVCPPQIRDALTRLLPQLRHKPHCMC